MLADKRYCYPLTITDSASRYLLCCEALETTKLTYAFTVFERVFKDFGLPLAIRTDNGVPFASRSTFFGLSKLSVWWLRLGIGIERIKPGNPQQNGALTEPEYPFHDRTVLVTHCGRICIGKRKISLSHAFAGQWVGIREIEEKICKRPANTHCLFGRPSTSRLHTQVRMERLQEPAGTIS